MARVQRRGDWRAEIDIAQTHHEIGGLEEFLIDLVDRFEAVDAADEFEVARAPRGIRADALHVSLDGLARAGIVPTERQVRGARGHLDFLKRRQRFDAAADVLPKHVAVDDSGIEVDLQRTDAGGEIDDARKAVLSDPFVDTVGLEAEFEVEVMWAEFDEEISVASAAEHDGVVARAEGIEDWRL